MEKNIEPLKHGLQGDVLVPGDKSISHRALILSAIAEGRTEISGLLISADVMATLKCLQDLGVHIEKTIEGKFIVDGHGLNSLREPSVVLDAKNSGTTARLLLGLLAGCGCKARLTGDASLCKRPMRRVAVPLQKMGAAVKLAAGDVLPAEILPREKGLSGIRYSMPVASAQVKSAILLAGLYAEGETTVKESLPARDHTEKMLQSFGAVVYKEHDSITLQGRQRLVSPGKAVIPGDISSAAYWLTAAAVMPGSELVLHRVGINSTRTGVIDVLCRMGADITYLQEYEDAGEKSADILVRGSALSATKIEAEEIPRLIDEIPIIAVAAMFAQGKTEISGAEELRVKETDRLQVIAAEYNKFAEAVLEKKDGLIIEGKKEIKWAAADSHGDHRIAMSLAVLGMLGKGAKITNAACVDISYPDFFETLAGCSR